MPAWSIRLVAAGVLLTLTVALHPSSAGAGPRAQVDGPEIRPMIFVHGFLGSGQQFESQALRFTSNGYPADHIEVFEHDSLAYPGSQAQVFARIDQLVADLQARTGDDQVYLLGHSQGTGVVQGYLNSSADRAAGVAKYVNLDGGAGGTVPASVETLAVWGEGNPARQIPGATNVQFPDQAHTEVVNSPETFAAIHEFFTGTPPELSEVVREPADEIEVSGRAVLFPQNGGAAGARLAIYQVDGRTGLRLDGTPEATFALGTDGAWGPFDADGEAFYEFAVERETGTHHVYMQPFVRSSRWVRILTSEPGGLADSFWKTGDDHQNLAILRNKEWWGDQGTNGDTLRINGVDVLNAANSPRSNRTIGIFVHDANVDGVTDLVTPVTPFGIPFLTGIDLVLPATDPPTATMSIVVVPRLGGGPESVCIPNYSSTRNRSSVQLNSYHQLLSAHGKPARGHANPTCAPSPAPPAPPARPVPGRPDFTG